jgi:hypothetical protein
VTEIQRNRYYRLVFGLTIFMVVSSCSRNQSSKRNLPFVVGEINDHTWVTFKSLLEEMCDPDRAGRFPETEYRSLQASSYNTASVAPDKPGWFADSDGIGYIREEVINGEKEFVIMEHDGPGCLTRLWTPFFYYDFNNRVGPRVRIYLDGNKKPLIDENFIALLMGKGSVKPPFAGYTARAGVCFLPIPFSKSCKITLDDKPFYNIINYRAYEKNTKVKSYTAGQQVEASSLLSTTASALANVESDAKQWHKSVTRTIKPGDTLVVDLPVGNHAIKELSVNINEGAPSRSAILKIDFDGAETVWCPVGDFFSTPEETYSFKTRNLRVSPESKMTCGWVMPYESMAEVSLVNVHNEEVSITIDIKVGNWDWDNRSMYFHANWSAVGMLPGDVFLDLNFIDISGKGVLVGDALTVLSPSTGWWGEGDEKIYVDETDVNRRFPSHFGTGTEDYYGWAGGVVPTGEDVFSIPCGANVRNGNAQNPKGYNVCLRNRILDDVPFNNRLVFDMEASPGTDIRNHWNLLSYSTVTYWYGMPGATSNRDGRRDLVETLPSLMEIEHMQELLKDSIISFDRARLRKKLR